MTLNTASGPQGITTGNFCNNSRTDIAVAHYNDATVYVYCNTGSTGASAFSATATKGLTTSTAAYGITSGNLCGNGDADIAVANFSTTTVYVYCNTGSTGAVPFPATATTTLNTGSEPYYLTTGNICANGHTDLAVTNLGSSNASIYCNTGSTGASAFSATATKTLTTGSQPTDLTTDNLCNNGQTDLEIVNYGSATASTYCSVPGSAVGSNLNINSSSGSSVGLLIQGASGGQTSDLLDLYSSGGLLLSSINAAGDLCIAAPTCGSEALGVNGAGVASGGFSTGTPDMAEYIDVSPGVTAGDVVIADPNNAEAVTTTGTTLRSGRGRRNRQRHLGLPDA